jgi:hypothetical protein
MEIQRHPEDLRKPLKVHFVGEEGVDEGGVQKEFFQLLIRQVFDPSFGRVEYHFLTHVILQSKHGSIDDSRYPVHVTNLTPPPGVSATLAFGMFSYNDETRSFWFSASSMLGLEMEYELIGGAVQVESI